MIPSTSARSCGSIHKNMKQGFAGLCVGTAALDRDSFGGKPAKYSGQLSVSAGASQHQGLCPDVRHLLRSTPLELRPASRWRSTVCLLGQAHWDGISINPMMAVLYMCLPLKAPIALQLGVCCHRQRGANLPHGLSFVSALFGLSPAGGYW